MSTTSGCNEVDLVAPAVASQQALFVDLSTACASDCGRLLAPSGQPLSTIAPPAGDGTSNAIATGGTARSPTSRSRRPSLSRHPVGLRHGGRHAHRRTRRHGRGRFDLRRHCVRRHRERRRDLRRRRHLLPRPRHRRVAHHAHPGRIDHRRPRPDRSRHDRPHDPVDRPVGRRRLSSRRRSPTATPGSTTTPRSTSRTARRSPQARALSLTVGTTTFGQNSSAALHRDRAGGAAAADDQNNGDRGARLGSGDDVAERGIDVGAGSTLTGGTVNLFASVVKMEIDSNATGAGLRRLLRPGLRQHQRRRLHRHLRPRARCRNHHQRHQWRRHPRPEGRAGHPAGPTALITSRGGYVQAVALISPQKLSFEGTELDDHQRHRRPGRHGDCRRPRLVDTVEAASGAGTALYVQSFNKLLDLASSTRRARRASSRATTPANL